MEQLNNKKFLLENDLLENRQFQFFVENTRIIQENGTNPRIRRMSQRAQNEFITVTESLPEYEVRVIGWDQITLFTLTAKYRINNGIDSVQYKAVNIQRSQHEGLYVKIFLVKAVSTV